MNATHSETSTRNDQPVSAVRRDYRQEATVQIVEMLEKGTAPWQKPWEPGALALPFNPTSERNYRGGNALQLIAVAARKGYDDPRWLTYRQARENGWQVRQGEKGTQIEYWQFDDRAGNEPPERSGEKSPDPGPEAPNNSHRGLVHRVYTVFNAKQIDGISEYVPKQRQEWEITETGEQILRNSSAKITHDQNDSFTQEGGVPKLCGLLRNGTA
jgi:antirestriction protein ArdC